MRIALLACCALAACTGAPDVVRCSRSSQCTLDGKAGRCEATGLCSFADPACATGQRYSERFAGDASGTCVPKEVPRWATVIGGVTSDTFDDLVLGSGDRVYAYGRFFDELALPERIEGAGNYDLLLASLDPDHGGARWLFPFGGALGDSAGGVGFTSDGRVHVGGRFSMAFSLAGTELSKGHPSQAFGTFHATFDDTATGPALRGALVTAGTGTASPSDVDGYAIAGEWQGGSLDFSAGDNGDAVEATGQSAWLAAAQEVGWGATATLLPTAASGDIRVHAVVQTNDAVVIGGRYSGAVTFAGAPLLPLAMQSDGYFATWRPATPTVAPATLTVRGAGPDSVVALADAGAEVLVAAAVASQVSVLGETLPPIGAQDALVFGSTGGLRPWRVGTAGGSTTVSAIAAYAGGAMIAGTYDRPLTLGAFSLPHRGGLDAFVAQLRADGTVAWAHSLGGPADDLVGALAVSPRGVVFLGLTFEDEIELGGGATRRAAGDSDWLVLALAPW